MSAGRSRLEFLTASTFVQAVEAGKKTWFTPNATRAIAIAMIWWTRMADFQRTRLSDDIIGTARKAAGGPYRKLLGHMTKVPKRYPDELDIRLTYQIGDFTIARTGRSLRPPRLSWSVPSFSVTYAN